MKRRLIEDLCVFCGAGETSGPHRDVCRRQAWGDIKAASALEVIATKNGKEGVDNSYIAFVY